MCTLNQKQKKYRALDHKNQEKKQTVQKDDQLATKKQFANI
ncbi:hypothetical protein IMCC1989_2239 [gamma proteobacterium IMCC1989]|nr:hypothetical protein IMCC1989_2239 [gamma proteobacterium IMCC1989]